MNTLEASQKKTKTERRGSTDGQFSSVNLKRRAFAKMSLGPVRKTLTRAEQTARRGLTRLSQT